MCSAVQTRVQTLEEERLSVTTQLAVKREEASMYSRDLLQLREQFQLLETKNREVEAQLLLSKSALTQLEIEKELRAKSELREESERSERIAATAQAMAIESDCNSRIRAIEEKSQSLTDSLGTEIKTLGQDKILLNTELQQAADMITALENELKSLRAQNTDKEAVNELGKVKGELEVTKKHLKELTEQQNINHFSESKKLIEYEERLKQSEIQRRKLHNLVQELRGNIRVFARVRPFLPSDGIDTSKNQNGTIATVTETNSLRITKVNNSNGHENSNETQARVEDHAFQFDKVFGPSATQENIFMEVSEFVQSALDGYHVCLFSYGQTGNYVYFVYFSPNN